MVVTLPLRKRPCTWRSTVVFPGVQAICHTHSVYALTFCALGKEIPPSSLELLICGAPIPVAPWARPGTTAVGEGVVALIAERPELKVVLLQNHGLVAIGQTLDQAFAFAYDAEIGLQAYYQACLLGEPVVLSKEQMAEIFKA
jgi:L-fuculose-phosphate aldolase